jgi:hypothetical protein
MKTDLSGNFLWCKNYSGYSSFESVPYPKLNRISDSTFMVAYGTPYNPGGFLKTVHDSTLAMNQNLFLSVTGVAASNDGGYLVIGNGPIIGVDMTETYNPQVGVIKTDSTGYSLSCDFGESLYSTNYSVTLGPGTFTVADAGLVSGIPVPVENILLSRDSGCVAFMGSIQNKNQPDLSFDVFPNPTDGVFRVKVINGEKEEMKRLEVYNTLGEKIFASSDPGMLRSTINLGKMPEGVYSVRVVIGNTVCSQKLLINR